MAKQKPSGWLDKYASTVAASDATRVNKQLTPTNKNKVTQEQLDEREAQARRDRIDVSNIVQPHMFSSPKNFAVASSAIADKLRFSEYPNVFDDYINPAVQFGHLASGLGKVPLNIQEGNYGQAALNTLAPVAAGRVEKVLDPIISKGLRTGRTAVDQNFTKVGKQLADIAKEGVANGLSPQEIKMQQMQQVGITSLQREGYVPGVSEVVSEYITPYSYDTPLKRVLDIPRRIVAGEKNSKNLSDVDVDFIFNGIDKGVVSKPRYDAWRMYGGLPQEHGTFRLAETSPIDHPSYSAEQLSNLEKFSLNNERQLLNDLPSKHDTDLRYLKESDLAEALPELQTQLRKIQQLKDKGIDVANDFTRTNVMGGYNRRFFDNKMEYNDIWDLDLNGTKVENYFGKPFLSHGQLDYSFQPAEDALKRAIQIGERYQSLGENINSKKMEFFDTFNSLNNIKQLNPKDLTVNKKENGGWLEKYNDGGPVQENYNDYSVSAPEGFVGDGYSNVGRNYSPAWGGQFAMGGSMPGTVGFMYARTQDPAPSKGKYAKKTMASAQNGTEMEYYQNGLDWKPKSMAGGGTTPKSKPLLNLGDFTMTPAELEYVNADNSGYCPGGNCLENTKKGYDMTAGRIPGIPSSNDIWTKDLKIVSTASKPSEKLVKQYPYFAGDSSFGSADSWDIHGAIVKAGGKNIYSQAKGQGVPKDIPIGAFIGWGPSGTRVSSHSDRQKGLNTKYGLQPSHHSTQVVSYNEQGEPIVYDSYLGKYGSLSEISKDLQSSLGYEVENISVPKSVAGNTRDSLSKRGLLRNELTPYSADINKLIAGTKQGWAQIKEDGKMRSPNVDQDALQEFASALHHNKGELISSLRLKNEDYDRLANTALAIAMAESEGGGALGFADRFGSTQGMTQLNIDNIKNDARLKSALDKNYKSKVSVTNLLSPTSSAIATLMYLSKAEKDAKRLYEKGLKPGERSFNEPGFIENFRATNSRLNKEGVFIDELNKRIPYSQIPGYEENDVNKVNSYLKKMTKSDRYNFVNKDGDMSLKVKTKGNNPKLTDIEKIAYMWQSPNALKTGDAEGKSEYVNKIKNYYNLLSSKKMEQGGQLTKLDQLTNFTNYNTKQPGGWLDKYEG